MLTRKIFILLSVICIFAIACTTPNKSDQVSSNPVSVNVTTEPSDNNDCVFDTSTYKFTTEALRKFDNSIQYKWDSEAKQAKTILNNGDTLYLSIGGCNHFAYSAILITRISFDATDSLLDKTGWIAKTFFKDGFENYSQLITSHKFNKSDDSEAEYSIYNVFPSNSVPENCIFEGFTFAKLNNNSTRIDIGGYIN